MGYFEYYILGYPSYLSNSINFFSNTYTILSKIVAMYGVLVVMHYFTFLFSWIAHNIINHIGQIIEIIWFKQITILFRSELCDILKV